MPVHVGAQRFELRLPQARSLKEKRAVLRPIIEGSRRRYGVAAAEVADQDRWHHAVVAVAAVSSRHAHVVEILDAVERFVWSFPEIEVLSSERGWLDDESLR